MVLIPTERFFTTKLAGSVNIILLDHRKRKTLLTLQACFMN